MRQRVASACCAVALLVGCHSEPGSESQRADATGQSRLEGGREHLPALKDYLEQHDLAAGEWREENGVRLCEGYLTRFADTDYCAAAIPKDWTAFTFNGQNYYVQPLASDADRQ